MEPGIWIPLVVGVISVLIALHAYMAKRRKDLLEHIEKRIEEQTVVCVKEEIGPVVKKLEKVTAKLDNGILHATKKHTEEIADLRVNVGTIDTTVNHIYTDVSNLSRQLEAILTGKGRT